MIQSEQFQYGENEVQEYFEYRNSTHQDGLTIIRNKPEVYWFAMYFNREGGHELILEQQVLEVGNHKCCSYRKFETSAETIQAAIEWYLNYRGTLN